MKVYMGPYKEWWGAYQLTDLLQKVGVSQNRCDKIGDKLDDSWIHTFCEWIHSKRNRKIRVRIDYFDTWNTDSTLSYIIVPMLKQLKKVNHSTPWVVDDNDVPDHLKSPKCAAIGDGPLNADAARGERQKVVSDSYRDNWNDIFDKKRPGGVEPVKEPVKEGETDDYHFERWNWVLDEMIWAFEQVNTTRQTDASVNTQADERMNRGFILFGKYYSSLWD